LDFGERDVEVIGVKVVEHCLVLHELDLEVLVGFVVVGQQIVDALKQSRQRLAVVLLLQQEFLLRKHLHQVHQTVAGLPTQ